MHKTRVARFNPVRGTKQPELTRLSLPMMLHLQPTRNSTTVAGANPFVLSSRYANFKKVQESRPEFDRSLPVVTTQSPNPVWKYGEGAQIDSSFRDPNSSITPDQQPQLEQSQGHIQIDPNAPGRAMIQNYQVLISGIPRPISFVSTISADGSKNLSPFSYFQVVDHDPPIFVIGFSARQSRPKDTRRNLIETGECVINIVSEHMIEAVNATSLDLPHNVSEWELSGLTAASSSTVRPERVQEAIFSIEGRLLEMKDLDYGKESSTKPKGALAIIEATRFWIREDAINEEQNQIALDKLRPLVQLGGISYGRVRETFELPRPRLEEEMKDKGKGLDKYYNSEPLS
jgi:flavin reductase (DIM6/NTAB) family NADH-FMN oxidoreductase RutF